MFSRRSVLIGLGATTALSGGCASAKPAPGPIEALELGHEGRFGVAAITSGGEDLVSHRADERFAMCSTFKWLLAGLVLQEVDAGRETLERRVPIAGEDLVFHSPVTSQHVGPQGLPVSQLCAATIGTSDNTAANLLLAGLGGPDGFTQRLRTSGDTVTRLDRMEPALNENAPGDPRDTTTPRAMARNLDRFLFGSQLSDPSRDMLRSWMIAADTGLDRLRAGLPAGWTSGDKTGTSSNGANNDVAFSIPPHGSDGKPLIIASYLNLPDPVSPEANALHAKIAGLVSARL